MSWFCAFIKPGQACYFLLIFKERLIYFDKLKYRFQNGSAKVELIFQLRKFILNFFYFIFNSVELNPFLVILGLQR